MEKGDTTELKCIFSLFDPTNQGKIDIAQINKINKKLNALHCQGGGF
jgi:Ca2+-binding EF-hand superfamily protein